MAEKYVPELGKLIQREARRDAIHIAVAPLTASEVLHPGQEVGLADDGTVIASADRKIGIVDPFLKGVIRPGLRVWVMLFPNTITGLRHEWEHPAFDHQEPEESKRFLKQFAETAGMSYTLLIQRLEDYVETGEPWVERDSEYAVSAYYDCDRDEFWRHVKAVTGLVPLEGGCPFSCTC